MSRLFACKLFICLTTMAGFLYAYLEEQNELTKLQMEIPYLSRSLKEVTEENQRLDFEIERFEHPQHLMELVLQSEYSHLKHPVSSDVVLAPSGEKVDMGSDDREKIEHRRHTPRILLGSK